MRRFGMVFLLVAVICAGAVHADEVTLKNGDRLTGTIEKSDAKILAMKSDFAGEVSIQWDAITSIHSPQPLYLGLKDGQTIAGMVTTSADSLVVATKNAGTITTVKDSVVTVRNEAEQTAFNTEVERLRNPRLTDFWSGFLDSGLSVTRGNRIP